MAAGDERWAGVSLATGADLAIVTAHPFDISALRLQASIKKIDCLPAYRLVLEPDEEAQELAVRRGKMIAVAMQMGPAGLPACEFEPRREEFPCTYCPFRAKCIGDGMDYGIALPEIPQDMRIKPAAEIASFIRRDVPDELPSVSPETCVTSRISPKGPQFRWNSRESGPSMPGLGPGWASVSRAKFEPSINSPPPRKQNGSQEVNESDDKYRAGDSVPPDLESESQREP